MPLGIRSVFLVYTGAAVPLPLPTGWLATSERLDVNRRVINEIQASYVVVMIPSRCGLDNGVEFGAIAWLPE